MSTDSAVSAVEENLRQRLRRIRLRRCLQRASEDAATSLHHDLLRDVLLYDWQQDRGVLRLPRVRTWMVQRRTVHTTRGLVALLARGGRTLGPLCPDMARQEQCPTGADCPYIHVPPGVRLRPGPPADDPAYAFLHVNEGGGWSLAPFPQRIEGYLDHPSSALGCLQLRALRYLQLNHLCLDLDV